MLCVCKISRCFNDRPNEIFIIEVDKFNLSFTMILWANWNVRTWNQKSVCLDVRRRREEQFYYFILISQIPKISSKKYVNGNLIANY